VASGCDPRESVLDHTWFSNGAHDETKPSRVEEGLWRFASTSMLHERQETRTQVRGTPAEILRHSRIQSAPGIVELG
jgi:hypothetical protein